MSIVSDISAFLVPITSVVTVCILFNQWVAVRNKSKMDLFDIRFKIYKHVREALAVMIVKREFSDSRLMEYNENVSGAKWIFDSRLGSFICDEVQDMIIDYQKCYINNFVCNKCICCRGNSEDLSRDIMSTFRNIESKFDPFMHLDNGGGKYAEEILEKLASRKTSVRRQ